MNDLLLKFEVYSGAGIEFFSDFSFGPVQFKRIFYSPPRSSNGNYERPFKHGILFELFKTDDLKIKYRRSSPNFHSR